MIDRFDVEVTVCGGGSTARPATNPSRLTPRR